MFSSVVLAKHETGAGDPPAPVGVAYPPLLCVLCDFIVSHKVLFSAANKDHTKARTEVNGFSNPVSHSPDHSALSLVFSKPNRPFTEREGPEGPARRPDGSGASEPPKFGLFPFGNRPNVLAVDRSVSAKPRIAIDIRPTTLII